MRLTERFDEDVDAIEAYVHELLPAYDVARRDRCRGDDHDARRDRARAGRARCERVHGHALSTAAVDELLARLAALPLDERRRLPGLEPERAPVIVAGAAILRTILAATVSTGSRSSEHDLLHGAALAAAELPAPAEGDAPPGAYTCC